MGAASLEEILAATEAHRAQIQSGKGLFRRIWDDTEERSRSHRVYEGEWFLRGDHLRLRYKGVREGRELGPNTGGAIDEEYENSGFAELSVSHHEALGMARPYTDDDRRTYYTLRGFHLPGLTNANFAHIPLESAIALMQSGRQEYAITEDPRGLIRIRRRWNEGNDPGGGEIVIDPAKQYSVLEESFEGGQKIPVRESGRVTMEWVADAGIWFPSRGVFEYFSGTPSVPLKKEVIEFHNTKLNVPVSDAELEVTVPVGTLLTDGFSREGYKTNAPLTLKQIVSGDGWRLNVANRVPAAPTPLPQATGARPSRPSPPRNLIPLALIVSGVVLVIVAALWGLFHRSSQ